MSDWIDCEPSVDMNDDEYMCLDMYGLPAEYDELPLLPDCWLAACELDDRSEECDMVPRPDVAAEVSVSTDGKEPGQKHHHRYMCRG